MNIMALIFKIYIKTVLRGPILMQDAASLILYVGPVRMNRDMTRDRSFFRIG